MAGGVRDGQGPPRDSTLSLSSLLLSSPFVSSSKLPSSYGRLLSSYGRLYTGGSTFPIWQAVYYMVAFAQPGAADLSHGDEAQIERLQAGA
jgi:hypothetical protein